MAICDCDIHDFPPLLDIESGLKRLPRQIGTFGDFRAAMLASIRDHAALRHWRARDREDFGLMILEWWAYVADVIAFYNAEHAQDLYLGTARDNERIRQLAGLIGYRPKPALAAEAMLAAIVDGADPLTAPARARFIADAIDDTPPQEFELVEDTVLDPLRNRWTLASIRDDLFDRNNLLLDPGSRNLVEDDWLVVSINEKNTVHQVRAVTPETALDEASYLRLEITNSGRLTKDKVKLSDVRLWTFTQSAPVLSKTNSTLQLTGLFPQLRKGELVLVEDVKADQLDAPQELKIVNVTYETRNLTKSDTDTKRIMTSVTLVTLSGSLSIDPASARLRFGRVRAGKLVAPARTELTLGRILAERRLAGRHDRSAVAGRGELLLKGKRNRGVQIKGDVTIDDRGRAALNPSGQAPDFEGELRTPVEVFGNLLRITRGRTVEEVLGSGQGAGVPFQTFSLAKSPLTYLMDQSAPGGRRSTLRLYVDGIEWKEVESLFLNGPDDRVFTVDLDPSGKATITFGDGQFGRPPPLGSDNVFAVYRFGAGDPPPPANTIQQIAGPVPRLRRIFNVTHAFGGGAGDRPEDIRFNAPASAATFDRAVSAFDFAALAKSHGALNAVAVTEWVPERLREGVVVVVIFEGEATPDAIRALEAYLASKAAEATPIRVIAAKPRVGMLKLSYTVAEDANPADVAAALEAVFLHPFTGLLSSRRAAIGGPVFRSALLGAAAKVAGIGTLRSLTLDGLPMPARLALHPHGYFAPKLELEGPSA